MDNTNNLVQQIPPIQTPSPLENQPSAATTSINKRTVIISVVILLFVLIGVVGGYFLGFIKGQSNQSNVSNNSKSIGSPSPVSDNTITEPQVLPTAIRIPFVRDGNVYLLDNGQENLIASSTQKSTFENRYDNAYPFMSPNGKFLAYISFTGKGELDPQGTLKIYDIDTKQTKTTQYNTDYFHWNVFNQLEFSVESLVKVSGGEGIDMAQSKVTYIVLDPESLQQLASQTMSWDERNQSGIGGFPLYSNKKAITFRDNGYYLTDTRNNTEKLLFEKGEIYHFSGWAPDGSYVVFLGAKQNPFKNMWMSVNTIDPNLPKTEIKVRNLAGGAGGEASTGLKWYFNKGFVMYCMEDIFFVDGRESLELTHTRGGGCHNEEGFVATSPNGEYAFVKFDDRFELHTQSGEKQTINESTPINKTRSTPKNLVWINNDYMIIYESTFVGSILGESSNNPKIYLFDKNANVIKPIVNNAYLSTFAVGVR